MSTDQLNNTVQETTGVTPHELVFGQGPRHGLNIMPKADQIAEEDIQDIVETTVFTLIFHHSNCSSPLPKCCNCLLSDDEEGSMLIPRFTF